MSKNWTPKDTMTKEGAQDLAAKIAAYWMSRGYQCDVRIERVTQHDPNGHNRNAIYVVRSDLENGLPKGAEANVVF